MPAAVPPHVRPRFPQASFPISNGTSSATETPTTPTSTELQATKSSGEASKPSGEASKSGDEASKTGGQAKTSEPETPSSFPTPSLVTVDVRPASEIYATTTTHASVASYEGPSAIILKGYCTEPGYTILDGPTAYWVPVVGCISSKSECCPTPTADGGAGVGPTANQKEQASVAPTAAAGGAGAAAFPISSLPSQGQLTGCPKDYHTVKASVGAACCPSSYWLWSTALGGQIPCYSSLGQALVPPPMPDTFLDIGRMTETGSITATTRATALTMQAKPTSAIINIAYAMQYQLAPEPESSMKKETKIGIGAGVAGAALLILVLLGFFIRRCLARKRIAKSSVVGGTSASQRFGSQIDMSRVAHEPAGVARTYDGAKYAGVSTKPVHY